VWKDGATAVLMTKQVLPRPRSVPWWAVVRRALLDLPAGRSRRVGSPFAGRWLLAPHGSIRHGWSPL